MAGFKSSFGHEFRVWHDPDGRTIIKWSDQKTGSWTAEASNEAGAMISPVYIPPDVQITQEADRIRFGDSLMLLHCGHPFIYGVIHVFEEKPTCQEVKRENTQPSA